MALRRDSKGFPFCPHCGSHLEHYTGIGAMIGAMFVADILTWTLAAIFVGIGMLWTPAYIVAACIVLVGIVMALRKQPQGAFACRKCGRVFTAEGVEA